MGNEGGLGNGKAENALYNTKSAYGVKEGSREGVKCVAVPRSPDP